jgi:hypothetical protein
MISFEELSQRFPVQNVAPYGPCVVVPGSEFNPDWEVFLGDQGYSCRFSDLDGKPVTLVQHKNARSNGGEKTVYVPQKKVGGESMESKESKESGKKGHGCQKGPSWSPEEEQRLLKRMQELTGPVKARARQLEPEFGRSAIALIQKHKKLLKAEKAKKGPKPETAKKSLKNSDEVAKKSAEISSGPESIPVAAAEPASPSASEADSVVSLLSEIRDLLKPDSFDFEYHCPKCNEHGTVSCVERVWQHCPVCGAPLIVWSVED